MEVGYHILFALMLATVAVLIAGVLLMGFGGNANRRYGNRLMMARVSLQGMAILMLAILFLVGNK